MCFSHLYTPVAQISKRVSEVEGDRKLRTPSLARQIFQPRHCSLRPVRGRLACRYPWASFSGTADFAALIEPLRVNPDVFAEDDTVKSR